MKKKNPFFVTLDARNANSHRIFVTITAQERCSFPSLLQFPIWTPGSYMVREYSRHITKFQGGEKINKNSWRISADIKKISYEVYCFERTVRTSYLDDNYAALVGATLLPILGKNFTVKILFPHDWSFVSSALNFKKDRAGEWHANIRDDDHWIDSPIVAARPGFGARGKFALKGINHEIAWVGSQCEKSMKELERDFSKIASVVLGIFNKAPMKNYHFLLHFGAKLYGGLEHRDSQLSQFDGSTLNDEKEYKNFIRLIAHEYFHSWNVKSLRPKPLGPFKYFEENYTEDLWFAEGITDYFDDIIPFKAGFLSEKEFLEERFDDIKTMNDFLPGHSRRSLKESSFDAWIRAYRPDEDSANTDISYYSKGSILGWCWDAHLQKKSRGKWTLEKLMRSFWEKYGIDAYEPLSTARPGFTRNELLLFAEKITKIPQKTLVESWVVSRKPLPWRDAAKFFHTSWMEKIADPTQYYLGMQIQWKASQATVQKVYANSAAEKAGLCPGDEILAIDNYRVSEQQKIKTLLRPAALGKKVNLCISRSDRVSIFSLSPFKHKDLGMDFVPSLQKTKRKK